MREWFRIEAATGKKGGGEILIFSHIGKRWSQDPEAVDAKVFVEGLQGIGRRFSTRPLMMHRMPTAEHRPAML